LANKSWTSVEIISIDLDAIELALDAYVVDLSRRPEVTKVVLFGSMVSGRYAPGSDVDLLIVLTDSEKPFRNRMPGYFPKRFPVGLDIFPYTEDEVQQSAFAQEALGTGKILWRRDGGRVPV